MNNDTNLIVAETDFIKLNSLIKAAATEAAELLEEELGRATVVSDTQLPADVVAMNSRVSFEDLDSGLEMSVTLVYPHEVDIEENKISILAPVGSALIGLRVGQDIQWPLPNGRKKRLRVKSVHSQPALVSQGS